MNLTGKWKGDDGGVYYVRQGADNEVWMTGEASKGDWARVFQGSIKGKEVTGSGADVPRGALSDGGPLTFSASRDGNTLEVKSSQWKTFAAKSLKRAGEGYDALPFKFIRAGYADRDGTGAWLADDGGYYYVRAVAGAVWWFAGHPADGWAHVFKGEFVRDKSGDTRIVGKFSDVPRGLPQPTTQTTGGSGVTALKAEQLGLTEDAGEDAPPPKPRPLGGGSLELSAKAFDGATRVLDLLKSSAAFGGKHWVRADGYGPVSISFERLTCVKDTSEISADEPYAIMYVADLGPAVRATFAKAAAAANGASKPVAPSKLYRTSVFKEIDQKNPNGKGPLALWGIGQANGKALPAALDHPDDALVLVGLMEKDESNLENFINTTEGTLVGFLVNYLLAGDDKASIAKNLASDMNTVVDTTRIATSYIDESASPDADDRVGPVQELGLSQSSLERARLGGYTKTLHFSGEGGKYSVEFKVRGAYL